MGPEETSEFATSWKRFLISANPMRFTQWGPLVFGLAYLGAIPVFATLYTYLAADGFYAPYAQYEPQAKEDAALLEALIQKAMVRSYSSTTKPTVFMLETNRHLEISLVWVSRIRFQDDEVSFAVTIPAAEGTSGREGLHAGWFATITTSTRAEFIRELNPGIISFRSVNAHEEQPSQYKDRDGRLVNAIFPPAQNQLGLTAPMLGLTGDEEEQFQRCLKGTKGSASSFSGHWRRMLYLSVVVITTLGLGDIVPVTDAARLLLGLEAVTGVILAGLFLNAIANKARSR